MRKMKKMRSCLALALAAVFLGGCADGEAVDYVTESTEDAGHVVAGSVAQFEGEESWQDAWTATVEVDGKTLETQITVDAKVKLPGEESMSVVELKTPDYDAAEKEKIVKGFFGAAPVYADSGDTEEGEDASREQVTDYEGSAYVGEIDGKTFHLMVRPSQFSQSDWYGEGADWLAFYPDNLEDFMPEDFAGNGMEELVVGEVAGNKANNLCSLGEAEAAKLAAEALEKAGFADEVVSGTRSLEWTAKYPPDEGGAYLTDKLVDGYAVYFKRELPDETAAALLSDFYDESNVTTWSKPQEMADDIDLFGYKSHTVCYVNDRGVFLVDACNRYGLVSVTEDVGLLPLSSVCEIMKQELTDNAALYYQEPMKYNSLTLDYKLVGDEKREGCYSFIPVWELSGSAGVGNLYVNAIDGSVIVGVDILE